ncbi:hypothetical protein RZS08_40040, partial [Arthrospira platensis SPKY1]|nr:hypothetical protein [Arthrospira platensis SPKY1]
AFGSPIIGDNCSAQVVAADTTYNLSNCGEGTIVRTWTIQDPGGLSASCAQTLTVQNQTPFDGTQIIWPLDYTENNTCVTADQLDPEDLPSIFSEPVLPDVNCALLAT